MMTVFTREIVKYTWTILISSHCKLQSLQSSSSESAKHPHTNTETYQHIRIEHGLMEDALQMLYTTVSVETCFSKQDKPVGNSKTSRCRSCRRNAHESIMRATAKKTQSRGYPLNSNKSIRSKADLEATAPVPARKPCTVILGRSTRYLLLRTQRHRTWSWKINSHCRFFKWASV